MQTARILQAVILMMIVALAASCTATKQYTSKLFAPRTQEIKDSQAIAVSPLRFLELDSAGADKNGWVTTDIIMGRDTISNTLALDNLAKTLPATPVRNDSATTSIPHKTNPAVTDAKPAVPETVSVAKTPKPGEVRSKRTREN